MNRLSRLGIAAALCLAVLPTTALAQDKSLKQQLVGTWTLVSAESVDADGKKAPLVKGADVKGLFVFTEGGRVSFQVIGDFAKIAANDRLKATPEEQKLMAEGVLSYFGTYTVDEADKSFTMTIERSSFPNQVGRPAKRMAAISGDELKVTNPGRLAGGQTNLVWKRDK
jgi:lipocalin-like protein